MGKGMGAGAERVVTGAWDLGYVAVEAGETTGKVSRTSLKEFGLEREYTIQMPPGARINERNRLLFAF